MDETCNCFCAHDFSSFVAITSPRLQHKHYILSLLVVLFIVIVDSTIHDVDSVGFSFVLYSTFILQIEKCVLL